LTRAEGRRAFSAAGLCARLVCLTTWRLARWQEEEKVRPARQCPPHDRGAVESGRLPVLSRANSSSRNRGDAARRDRADRSQRARGRPKIPAGKRRPWALSFQRVTRHHRAPPSPAFANPHGVAYYLQNEQCQRQHGYREVLLLELAPCSPPTGASRSDERLQTSFAAPVRSDSTRPRPSSQPCGVSQRLRGHSFYSYYSLTIQPSTTSDQEKYRRRRPVATAGCYKGPSSHREAATRTVVTARYASGG